MTENLIKSRLVQKHDIEANWLKATNFVPKQGELIVYDIEVDADGKMLSLPNDRTTPYTYERFKIGDGKTLVSDLPFAAAPIDATLTKAGMAADAKAVGDKIATKVDKVGGKQLSTNDFTDEYKSNIDALIGPYSKSLSYILSNDEYKVSSIGACTDTDIVIPSIYNGKRVTSIGDHAFRNCDWLINITIPDSITSIGDSAFYDCDKLTSVTIGNSVTTIGNSAFYNCSKLTSITIPDSVTSIGSSAFYACALTSITIPDSVTSIGDSAFYSWAGLTIYCEAETQPEGWDVNWNPSYLPVVYGAAFDIPSINKKFTNYANFDYVDSEVKSLLEYTNNSIARVERQISVTYDELKSLRDNSQLIPGMFYRITDYVCTTAQADTRAVVGTQFDIIVQALSENTLSETASACATGGDPVLMDSVLSNKIIKSHVTVYYREYIDFDGPGTDGLDPDYRQGKDVFVAYDYLENNEGEVVPVIFKTDAAGIDSTKAGFNSEFEDEDRQDTFYYVGTAEIDGVVYDKWRLIDGDTESTELKWDSASKAYVYTNQIVNNGTIELESFLYEEETDEYTLDSSAVVASYFEFVDHPDYSDDQYALRTLDDKKFAAYEYLPNNKGKIVPVLHDWLPEEGIGYNENYYYEGRATIDGEVYDKWRKIELDSEDFGWDTPGKAYYYTNVIVETSAHIVSTINFSAWEIKYCLDNDTTRFAWASEDDGKGIIYYMKDEHGNECPYDFKNIQFKRMVSLENGYPELDEENGEETWVYTFCGNSYHIDNDEWSELKDGSLESPYEHMSDEKMSTFRNNIIGKYVELYDPEDEDYTKCGRQYLNNNVFFGYWEEIGSSSSEECPYYYACCCGYNTLSSDCIGNTFGCGCQDNTLGDRCQRNNFEMYCTFNSFSYDCTDNTLQVGCGSIAFGYCCCDNILGEGCDNNTFGAMCDSNTLGSSCHCNTFGDLCYSNIVGYSFSYNIFSKGCNHNTFGNSCTGNTFGCECCYLAINGDYVRCIEVGSGVVGDVTNYLQITPIPNADYQQIYRKTGSKEIFI